MRSKEVCIMKVGEINTEYITPDSDYKEAAQWMS